MRDSDVKKGNRLPYEKPLACAIGLEHEAVILAISSTSEGFGEDTWNGGWN